MDQPDQQPPSFQMPDTMPVMVLDDCYLFPGCFLPLFIFEERYRQMLVHALGTSRMFCIGSRRRGGIDGDDELLPVSTAGLVRACRKQSDGTSHVMLYGISRIRITGWVQDKPFRIASVQSLPTSHTCCQDELGKLKAQVLGMLPKPTPQCSEAMQVLRSSLHEMTCPEMVCDILAYHFVRKPAAQRHLLMEPVLEKRYERLVQELERLGADC
jgi:ATP-dependent Lon protease